MSKERPILFSGPMVRALLDGSKTQTRRVIKDQFTGDSYSHTLPDGRVHLEWLGEPTCGTGVWDVPEHSMQIASPYGLIGDRLWVRETAKCGYRSEQPPANTGRIGVDFKAGGGTDRKYTLDRRDDYPWFPSKSHNADGSIRWTPGIHMPRWASRITLEVTGVRVERLHDITDADALAEGVDRTNTSIPGYARDRFIRLWTSISGNESWTADPWVWVVEFKRI